MGLINLDPYKPISGTKGKSADFQNAFDAIMAAVNGGIDGANFAAGLIFDPAKIIQGGALDLDALTWDAASGTWKPRSRYLEADSTFVDIVSTALETDLIGTPGSGLSVAGGRLAAGKKIEITVYTDLLQNVPSGQLAWKLHYGGANWTGQVINPAQSANRYPLVFRVVVIGTGAAAQIVFGSVYDPAVADPSSCREIPARSSSGLGTGTVDATADQALRLTVTPSGSSSSLELRVRYRMVEVTP